MKVIGFLGGSHAKFNWYQEQIKNQNIPVAYNQNNLLNLISYFINEEPFPAVVIPARAEIHPSGKTT